METAAAAMLDAGVGRFSRAPAMAAEMLAPLAVVLAALATLPSLQGIVLRIRSRGKEAIQSHIPTYYSSGDEGEDESSSDEASSSVEEEEEEEEEETRRIGYLEDGGCFPWGGSVVRTWQDLPRRCGLSGIGDSSAGFSAVRLWGAGTATGGDPWWSADEGGCDGAAAEAEEEVVVGWRRDHAGAHRRRALHTK